MREVLDQFKLDGPVEKVEPFGNGHIHNTYKVTLKQPLKQQYLLQTVNHEVFKDVSGVMRNISQVTEHIKTKLNPIDDQITLSLISTKDGKTYHQDSAGAYWRVYDFLDGLVSYDLAENSEQVYQGARSYGFFMKYLDDFPAESLSETIPDFHNILSRLDAFKSALEKPIQERKAQCKTEIEFVHEVAEQMTVIQKLKQAGEIKTRITHNDTKFNNVMLTPDNKGKCVVDLDTVMPGVVHFDFGDGIRTGACTVGEDEKDIQLVGLDMERFEAFGQGYLEVTRDYLSATELANLPLSGALLPYIMGVRFLTDYLSGDTYYKIKYEEHNWVRAKNQLHLTREILNYLPDLNQKIKKL